MSKRMLVAFTIAVWLAVFTASLSAYFVVNSGEYYEPLPTPPYFIEASHACAESA